MNSILILHYSIVLFSWLFFGISCSKIAQKKNRNKSSWFYIGVLLGIIGLLLIIFMRPIKIAKEIILTKPIIPVINDTNFWYFLDKEKKQIGPISLHKLILDYKNAAVFDETYVWNETMDNWQKIKDIPIISNILGNP